MIRAGLNCANRPEGWLKAPALPIFFLLNGGKFQPALRFGHYGAP